MKERRVELHLPMEVVPPLLDLLLPMAREEGATGLAFAPELEAIEDDFRDQWREDLAAQLGGDFACFLATFDTNDFRETGMVDFGADAVEPLLRAAAALRLKLRERRLNAVADTALEEGEVDFARLNLDERTAMLAYLLLGTFQEILVRFLDPKAADSEGEPSE